MRRFLVVVPIMAAVSVGAVLVAVSPAAASALAIQEFPTPTANSGPSGITLGSDGLVWFAEVASTPTQIASVNPGGQVVEYPVPAGQSANGGIVQAPDGNIWFTESDGFAYFNPATPTSVTEVPAPAGDDPGELIVGPDHNLWFADGTNDSIGRVLVAAPRTVSEFPLPITTPGSGPQNIATGPDDRVWVTDTAVGKVLRYNPASDSWAKYSIGPHSEPVGIAVGSDNSMWITDNYFDSVVQMSTSGAVTRMFSFPDETFSQIGEGPDGTLWFTEYQSGDLVQMDTSGDVLSESAIPTSDGYYVGGFTPGADGNLWFTENAASQIGRALLPHLNVQYIAYIPNRFFIPNEALLGEQGDTVSWLMLNPGIEGITDSSGMGLFGSGRLGIGQVYAYRFTAAGTYSYSSMANAGGAGVLGTATAAEGGSPRAGHGKVQVPITVATVEGVSSEAHVQWSSADPPSGFGFDVTVEQPGSRDYVDWETGTRGSNLVFGPSSPLYSGAGMYHFRGRIRNLSNGAASGWSTAGSIHLS